jgi:glycosyltransferase involved in cell wall biosynthesis
VNSARVLMTIPSLRCGGAERVFALVAGGLSAAGFEIHLALAQKEGAWLDRLPSAVTVHDLAAPRVRQAAWPLWRLVRRLRPRSVMSTMSHMNVVVGLVRAAFPGRTRVLLRESTSMHFCDEFPDSRPGAIHKTAYRAADRIICLTDQMCRDFHERMGIPLDRLRRIYNPIDAAVSAAPNPKPHAYPFPEGRGPHLLSIGRMDVSKGFDRLIAAFPQCLRRYPDATLTILGDGPDRRPLESQVRSLGIEDRVAMPGFQADTCTWLRSADLFVLASRFEGLPNVLLEALDAECPVVVLQHPGGSREVLDRVGLAHRWTTRLAEWPSEWLAPPDAHVRRQALQHFGFETIVRQYADVLRDLPAISRTAA